MRRAAALFAMFIACGTTGASSEVGGVGWVEETRRRLLAFDLDGSGLLEAGEVEHLPCDAFFGPADAWSRARATSFIVSHGLRPGLLFRGEPLGFAPDSVVAVPALEARCGLAEVADAENPTVLSLSRIESPPTSGEWDAKVAAILVAGHDRDKSGRVDSRLEIQDIPCEVLVELDRQVRSVTDVGVATLYGIEPGLVWIGPALGFGDGVRTELGERIDACELDADLS